MTTNGPKIFEPVLLPCGRQVANRLVKVAMYEHLASFFGGPPNKHHFALYEAWAKGPSCYGMVMTGNVQVDPGHLTLGRDMVLPAEISEASIAPFRQLATAIHTAPQSLAIMQLSHSGRQASRLTSGFQRPLSPGSIRVGSEVSWSNFISKLFYTLLFPQPRAMTPEDIQHVIGRFVLGAELACEAGFDGIQLHAAHGYLLAQFMNPKVNDRTDEYSAVTGNDLRVLHDIVTRIRETVPKNFVVGIKINAADYSQSDNVLTPKQQRFLNHIKEIRSWGAVDFIEVSGGDYESPEFIIKKTQSTRQAFFSYMASKAIETLDSVPSTPTSPPRPVILLTGGLKTPGSLHSALNSKQAELLGIGRSSVICPNLPSALASMGEDSSKWPDTLYGPEPQVSLPKYFPDIPLLGAGTNVAWYEVHMRYLASRERQLGLGEEPTSTYPDYTITGLKAITRMWIWSSS